MNRLFRVFAPLAIAVMLSAPAAQAVPIEIDPTASTSGVDISINSGFCLSESCSISIGLSDALDAASMMMDIGSHWSFDFFTITVAGLGVIYDADIEATLGFNTPEGMMASSTGTGRFFSFWGRFAGGALIWDDPDYILLADGSTLIVEFEDLARLGPGNTTTVTANIRRVAEVPEPATLALFGIGLVALAFAGRRRRVTNRISPRHGK